MLRAFSVCFTLSFWSEGNQKQFALPSHRTHFASGKDDPTAMATATDERRWGSIYLRPSPSPSKRETRERGRACPWCARRRRNYGLRHGHARAKLFALPLMPRLTIANLPQQSIDFLIFLLPPFFSIVTSSSTSNCSTSVFD